MNKEKYIKPMIDMLELNDDIILASGCVDYDCRDLIICLDLCDTDNGSCGGYCPIDD